VATVVKILVGVSGVSLFLAAVFSGALLSGDRIRANHNTETPEARAKRMKAAVVFLLVGLATAGLAWAVYSLG